MTRHDSNGNINSPGITAMGNDLRISRSSFLSWCVAMLCSVALLAGCATQHPVPGNPVTAKDHYLLGVRFYGQGQFDDAIREFSKAITLDPNYTDAYRWRAMTYSKTDFTAAVSDYTDVIRLQPREPGNYITLALAHNNLGDVERALADLDAGISLSQMSVGLHLTKADILFFEGRFPEALPEYRAALENLSGGSVTVKVVTTFLTSGLVGVLLDPIGQIENAKQNAKHQKQELDVLNERIQMCDAIVRRTASHETLPAIFKGMSKEAVLQSVLVTDRIVGDNRVLVLQQIEKNLFIEDYPQPECQVTVTRTGPLEDRTIGVLVFTDNKLTVEKRVPLKDVLVLPEISRTQTLINWGQPRAQVLETLRSTDKFIYEDDDFIVTFTECLPAKDKRVRVTMLRDGKVLLSTYGSRSLW